MIRRHKKQKSKAIVVLTRGYPEIGGYDNLIARNLSIEKNFQGDADLLIFHEGNISSNHQEYIQNKTKLRLIYIAIQPFDPIDGVTFFPGTEGFGWGYRHMCAFWFYEFFNYVSTYEFIIRIDEDCFIMSSLDEMFTHLEQKVCVYSYWYPKDSDFCTIGLTEFVDKNIEKSHDSNTKQRPSGPYTNLIGFNLNKLRSNDALFKFIEKVKYSKNIFIYRWGDLPLWGEVLRYLFDSQSYSSMPEFSYYHGSHKFFSASNPAIDAIETLRPKPCPFPLIKIGGDKDGAYLLPNDLQGIKACFSPGVNNFKNFEDELFEIFGITSHMCDFSSDVEKFKTPLLNGQTFKKKWLDVNGDKDSISLADWVNELEPDTNEDLLLQMDIEGAEYRNILNTPTSILNRFRIIVIELHGLNTVNDPAKFEKELGPLLNLLDQNFTCVHAHPNNCCGDVILTGSKLNIPRVHELTFLRKDRWLEANKNGYYKPLLPHPLDISQNNVDNPPLFLNEEWLESGKRAPESIIKMLSDQVDYLNRTLQDAKSREKLQTQSNSNTVLDLHRLAQHAASTQTPITSRPAALIDLAHNSKFSLSSTWAANPNEKIVTNNHPYFFHTQLGRNEFITVDLGEEYFLFELHISNRTDICKERARCLFYCAHSTPKPNLLTGLPVKIDEDFFSLNDAVSITQLVQCRARYLTVFSPEETYLHFSELKIFGLKDGGFND
jgi:hypothetical protein